MHISVKKAGLFTTLQDLGRTGWRQAGIPVSGAMDPFALRTANLLVGNEEGEAALEMTMTGPTLEMEANLLIAICGADLQPRINGQPVKNWRPVYVRKGAVLSFAGSVKGCRAYLAVAGGFAVQPVLGSKATYTRAGIGGFCGRALEIGDRLAIGTMSKSALRRLSQLARRAGNWAYAEGEWYVGPGFLPPYRANPTVRVTRGGQFSWFSERGKENFFTEAFQISAQSDRMGYRLTGPEISLCHPRELLSEAVTPGTVQVPADGQPIILMADCQTTGGYPKIAEVITADLPVLAQMKPGEKVRFAEVSVNEAQRQYRKQEKKLALLKKRLALL